MLLGFSGWMDGGEVSTGAIKYLIKKLEARKFADIDPEGFYIYNFPGSMEIASLFRPHTSIKDGLIQSYQPPTNEFLYDEKNNLILFLGREPNLQWQLFAECIFSICSELAVKTIYFIGSVAGLVPHTRQPRILCSVSDPEVKEALQHYGLKFTNYEGPASFITYLTANSHQKHLSMATLVTTIPAYVQGNNPSCLEAVIRHLSGFLELHIDHEDLRHTSDRFEKKLTDVIDQQPELAETIEKLEEDYDNEIFDSEMTDLKDWLQQKGVRLD
jgi:proteasome assembly chaperone (PAC2) family protein